MIQLCYISTARPQVQAEAVDGILAQSRRNNRRVGVTGLLLFNGKRFLQVLEGEPALVEQAYKRIGTDPRHFAIVKLSERTIEKREFDGWNMAYEQLPADATREEMLAHVAGLTATASPSVKALFTSYAAM